MSFYKNILINEFRKNPGCSKYQLKLIHADLFLISFFFKVVLEGWINSQGSKNVNFLAIIFGVQPSKVKKIKYSTEKLLFCKGNSDGRPEGSEESLLFRVVRKP